MTLIEVGETQADESVRGAEPGAEMAAMRPLRVDVWRRFRKDKLAMLGLILIGVLAILAVFGQWIAPYHYTDIVGDNRQGPSMDHLFGTDRIGRDLFSRVIYGARVSLRIAFVATLISTTIGLTIGAVAGFFGGTVDSILMRMTDVVLAVPYIVLAVAIATSIGRGENTIIIVLGFTNWLYTARIVRASFLQLRNVEFVEAARALGYSRTRIMFRHMFPNALQPIIVYATIAIGAVILSEAALSFLGVGPQDPTPAWGLMVADAKGLLPVAPNALFFPAAFIAITVMSFVFVGDGLRDAFDPKLK